MKKFGIILLLGLMAGAISAQDHLVQGVIHSFGEVPLIGAEIKVKSTKKSYFTDSLGQFFVLCNERDRLTVSALGFFNQEVRIKPKTKFIAVNLTSKSADQADHPIGYGTVSETDKTSAVSTSKGDQENYDNYTDIYRLIESRFAGVEVRGRQIYMRGSQTFQGSDAALIVVDDVIRDAEYLSTLKPIDVQSMSVIKDGTSAIYGSRGANGVLLIQTKKGGDQP